MKLLRVILIIYALAVMVGAVVLARTQGSVFISVYFGINGLIILLAVVFEHGRYKPKVSPGQDWEDSGEKFQDPTTGKWMNVRYNRRTGERDYVEDDQAEK